mmetsp:Transcript_38636/g.95089  ORF Transcript_38636/g.95089 Transcript_38636/m.95089 type:complete len:200 (-) Transcript_38636:4676-5275(-)
MIQASVRSARRGDLSIILSLASLHSSVKPTTLWPLGATNLKSLTDVGLAENTSGMASELRVLVPERPETMMYDSRTSLRSTPGVKDTVSSVLVPGAVELPSMVAAEKSAVPTLSTSFCPPPPGKAMQVPARGTSPLADTRTVSRSGPSWPYLGLSRSNLNVMSASLDTVSSGATESTRVPVRRFHEACELNFLMASTLA